MENPTPSRILITGFSGFVGGHLVERCRIMYPEARLFGVCRHSIPSSATAQVKDITPFVADTTNAEHMRHVVAETRPDLVFHLAAQSSVAASWADPASALHINASGAICLLEAIRAEHLSPRIVLVGSGEQYGKVDPEENPIREEMPLQPINPYGVSKAAQDMYGYQYFAVYGLPVLRIRQFNSFGPRQSATFVVADFARQIALIEEEKNELVLTVGNLQARRDFLPIEDVVRAYLAVAEQGQPGQAYNVGSGQAYSIGEILAMLLAHSTASIQIRTDPARLRPADVPLLVASISRIKTHTGWEPLIDIKHALGQTLNYWRAMVADKQSAVITDFAAR
jgi:GDP-4-dehydro-6-deoxy-D-mannose reductase